MITCLVNNTVHFASPCWGEHGLSLLVESAAGGRVLFDTGASGDLLLRNAGLLEVDLSRLDAVALSHGHYDHTGGLEALMTRAPAGTPLHANPDVFRERVYQHGDEVRDLGFRVSHAAVPAHFDVRLSAEPPGSPPASGPARESPRAAVFPGHERHAVRPAPTAAAWRPIVSGTTFLVVELPDGGLALVCGCCHAGLLNTLAHVTERFGKPVDVILGGTHLVSTDAASLQLAVDQLRDVYGSPRLHPNHCTGERAYVALAAAFGERVQPLTPGSASVWNNAHSPPAPSPHCGEGRRAQRAGGDGPPPRPTH
jgi:7,8-dihydropterin-6-yl-methyl-4-(beta-D-ribofuranosyl)aminobenzene 5'-phosphate synthase